jgi:hypothetical protein
MRTLSKKLVDRCVSVSIMQSTKPKILEL